LFDGELAVADDGPCEDEKREQGDLLLDGEALQRELTARLPTQHPDQKADQLPHQQSELQSDQRAGRKQDHQSRDESSDKSRPGHGTEYV